MDERKEFRAWCESLTESDWLIAQSFEESFFLGAWAAWRHLRTALAAATEREAYLVRRLQYEAEAHAASRRALRSAEGCERMFKEAAEAAESKLARTCGCEWIEGHRRSTGEDMSAICDYHAAVEELAQELPEKAAALARERARADALAARLAEVEK